jgi:hypothetical protein
MKLSFNLFHRKVVRDESSSVLDYKTTEELAAALGSTPSKNAPVVSPTVDSGSDTSSTSTTLPKQGSDAVVDWKLPVFDANTITEQTIDHELQRLIALRSYDLLEASRDEVFDHITTSAAELFHTPVAIINLIDLSRTWFVSGHGTGDLNGTPRSISILCTRGAGEGESTISRTRLDQRLSLSRLSNCYWSTTHQVLCWCTIDFTRGI